MGTTTKLRFPHDCMVHTQKKTASGGGVHLDYGNFIGSILNDVESFTGIPYVIPEFPC